MQIAIILHRTAPAPHWTLPRFVRRIDTRGRGRILTSPSATVADGSASLDALAMYRSPISENMATRDCLLELAQEKIDRAAALEDI